MSKGIWKFLLATNLEFMWLAKLGILGEDAKQAEEELEVELWPVFAVAFALVIFTLTVLGILWVLSRFGIVVIS